MQERELEMGPRLTTLSSPTSTHVVLKAGHSGAGLDDLQRANVRSGAGKGNWFTRARFTKLQKQILDRQVLRAVTLVTSFATDAAFFPRVTPALFLRTPVDERIRQVAFRNLLWFIRHPPLHVRLIVNIN